MKSTKKVFAESMDKIYVDWRYSGSLSLSERSVDRACRAWKKIRKEYTNKPLREKKSDFTNFG